MQLDNDTRQKGTDGPFEPWEGDHTALVHVLWTAKRAGLTLENDFDAIATMILRSRFLAARIAQALNAHDVGGGFQREADSARTRLAAAEADGRHPEYIDGLTHRVALFERLATEARA